MGASTNFQETLYTKPISISASGDNVMIAAPSQSGDYIAIDFLQLIPTNAVTVQFYSGASSSNNPISGPYPLSAQQVVTDENVFQNQHGVMECAPNQSFVINLGAAVQCGGFIRYRVCGN
jgi:hypothetical protein